MKLYNATTTQEVPPFERLVRTFAGDRRVCACGTAYLDKDCDSSSCTDNQCESREEQAREHVSLEVIKMMEKSTVDDGKCSVCGLSHHRDEFCPGAACSFCGMRGLHRCAEIGKLERVEQAAREFWELVYIACVERGYPSFGTREIPGMSEIADTALGKWRERFAPKKETNG